MSENEDLIAFLLSGSRASLQDAMLARLADSRNRRKELTELLDLWVEETALAAVYQWFVAHGEELAARLDAPCLPRGDAPSPQPFRLPSAIRNRKTWRKLR